MEPDFFDKAGNSQQVNEEKRLTKVQEFPRAAYMISDLLCSESLAVQTFFEQELKKF